MRTRTFDASKDISAKAVWVAKPWICEALGCTDRFLAFNSDWYVKERIKIENICIYRIRQPSDHMYGEFLGRVSKLPEHFSVKEAWELGSQRWGRSLSSVSTLILFGLTLLFDRELFRFCFFDILVDCSDSPDVRVVRIIRWLWVVWRTDTLYPERVTVSVATDVTGTCCGFNGVEKEKRRMTEQAWKVGRYTLRRYGWTRPRQRGPRGGSPEKDCFKRIGMMLLCMCSTCVPTKIRSLNVM